MIKTLRIKFTIIAMCSMLAVLTIIMGIFNITSYLQVTEHADLTLHMLADNDGKFPSPLEKKKTENGTGSSDKEEKEIPEDNTGISDTAKKEKPEDNPDGSGKEKKQRPKENDISPEAEYETRFFTVRTDSEGAISSYELENIAAIGKKEAREFTKRVLKRQNQKGFEGIYRYRLVSFDTGYMIIFLDCRKELVSFQSNLKTSVLVSVAGLFAVLVLVIIFSKIVFRPVAEGYQKQKRFITDASHELKIPLTIIEANTEVIEMENGESEWTKSTRNQIKRLSSLTNQLVTLSKLDENRNHLPKTEFCLSDAVTESTASFTTAAKASGKQLAIQAEENILLVGDRRSICQLINILIDNAVKYAAPESTIQITLKRHGKKAYLNVTNQTEDIPKGNLDILFERFYRLDSSRNSETGGSGIGLSVAHAIVQSHKGKISAYSADGKSICLQIILPL